MEKFFISAAGVCGLVLSGLCAYRYMSYADRSYVELLSSTVFLLCSIIAFHTLRYCKK